MYPKTQLISKILEIKYSGTGLN